MHPFLPKGRLVYHIVLLQRGQFEDTPTCIQMYTGHCLAGEIVQHSFLSSIGFGCRALDHTNQHFPPQSSHESNNRSQLQFQYIRRCFHIVNDPIPPQQHSQTRHSNQSPKARCNHCNHTRNTSLLKSPHSPTQRACFPVVWLALFCKTCFVFLRSRKINWQ